MYTKYDAIRDIFDIEEIETKISCWPFKVKVTATQLLDALSKESYTLAKEINVSPATGVSITKYLWPDKPSGNIKICTYLLLKYDLKYCSNCEQVKPLELFSKNSGRATGYNSHCKECFLNTTRDYQREYQRTRKALKIDRVPSWANLDSIKKIYAECPRGYHVDHIVPLQGTLVSGLHVEYNLQYLTAEENIKKNNKFYV